MLLDPAQAAQRSFAKRVRQFAKGRHVLLHGTRYGRQILTENRLRRAMEGDDAISFTRSADMAVHWALLPRDFEEPVGAVIVFDRQKLKSRYRLEAFHDPIWDTDESIHDEAEERIWGREIIGLSSLMVGIVWADGAENIPGSHPLW